MVDQTISLDCGPEVHECSFSVCYSETGRWKRVQQMELSKKDSLITFSLNVKQSNHLPND